MSQAAGRPVRATHHCSAVSGGVRGAVSGVVSDGSLGTKRSAWRRSTSTCATPARLRRALATARERAAADGLDGHDPDLRDLRAVALDAVERERRRGLHRGAAARA